MATVYLKPDLSAAYPAGRKDWLAELNVLILSAAYPAGRPTEAAVIPARSLSAAYPAGRASSADEVTLYTLSAAYPAGRVESLGEAASVCVSQPPIRRGGFPSRRRALASSLSRLSGGEVKPVVRVRQRASLSRLSGGEARHGGKRTTCSFSQPPIRRGGSCASARPR